MLEYRDGRSAPFPGSGARLWLAGVLSSQRVASIPPGLSIRDVVEMTEREGVLLLLEHIIGNHPLDVGLRSLKSALAVRSPRHVAEGMLRQHVLKSVSEALAAAGIRVLLLKGLAFGTWLYASPYLRESADIDLYFSSRADAEQAAVALRPLGYSLAFVPSGTAHEMTARAAWGATELPEIDLHWALVDTLVYASAFDFQALWDGSISMPMLVGVRRLGLVHSLAHACLHRAHDLGLSRPDRLKWLMDIHLMLKQMDGARWAEFLMLVRERSVSGVCLRSIEDCRTWLNSVVDPDVLSLLQLQSKDERVDWRRLHHWHYVQWKCIMSLPGPAARARWIWRRIFSSPSHLRELYGEGHWGQHLARRALAALARCRAWLR